MMKAKLSALAISTLLLVGCNTVQTANDVLPYPKAQVKEAVLNAMSVYDYDVYGVTKNRISGDEDSAYALFNTQAAPRIHVDMFEIDDNSTKVEIEFTKKKELLIKSSDESIHSKMMKTIRNYLATKFGGDAASDTMETTREDKWE